MVEGRGGEEWYSSRTRTGANSIAWWKGGVGRSGTPLAHVPEPIVWHGGRTGEKKQCSLRTHAGAILYVSGRTGWKRTVFFVVCAHVPEQKICIKEGSAGWKRMVVFSLTNRTVAIAHVPEPNEFFLRGIKIRFGNGKDRRSIVTIFEV
jgi:hypothetical protein